MPANGNALIRYKTTNNYLRSLNIYCFLFGHSYFLKCKDLKEDGNYDNKMLLGLRLKALYIPAQWQRLGKWMNTRPFEG